MGSGTIGRPQQLWHPHRNPCCNPESRAPPERVCGSSPRAGTGTDQEPVRAGADCGRADYGRSLLVAQTQAGEDALVSHPDGLLRAPEKVLGVFGRHHLDAVVIGTVSLQPTISNHFDQAVLLSGQLHNSHEAGFEPQAQHAVGRVAHAEPYNHRGTFRPD